MSRTIFVFTKNTTYSLSAFSKLYIGSILILLFLQFNLSAAIIPDSLFQSGNAKYKAGNFKQALVDYESIINAKYISAEVYFNIGNVYYNLRNYPKAILNYERALVLEPENEDISFNLNKARLYNVDKIDEIPEFVIRKWLNNLVSLGSTDFWSIVSIISFILGLVLLSLYFLTSKLTMKKAGFYLAILLLILSLGTYIFAFKSNQLKTARNSAIIISSTVTVKSTPSSSGNSLFIIHEGSKVEIIGNIDDWFEIRLSDGKRGWLSKNEVEKI